MSVTVSSCICHKRMTNTAFVSFEVERNRFLKFCFGFSSRVWVNVSCSALCCPFVCVALARNRDPFVFLQQVWSKHIYICCGSTSSGIFLFIFPLEWNVVLSWFTGISKRARRFLGTHAALLFFNLSQVGSSCSTQCVHMPGLVHRKSLGKHCGGNQASL